MIRRASIEDKSRVIAMARDFHAVSGVPFDFSAAAASVLFDAALVHADRLCLIYEAGGSARGVLAAQACLHYLAPVRVATELIWWIDPEWRGRAALAMIDAYEAWARERGCVYASLVGLGFEPAVAKLYERKGYAALERNFLKSL